MMHDVIDRRAERRPNTRQIARFGHPHVRVPDALVDVIRQLGEVLVLRLRAERKPVVMERIWAVVSSGVVVIVVAIGLLLLVWLVLLSEGPGSNTWLPSLDYSMEAKTEIGLSFMEGLVSPGHMLQPSVLFLEPLSYFAGCESSGIIFN